MKKLYVLGAGGHGKVCAEIAELNGYRVAFLDDRYPKLTQVEHWPVTDKLSRFIDMEGSNSEFFVAIGDNAIRSKWLEVLLNKKCKLPTLVHPSAVISKYAQLAAGSLIVANASINAFCTLGSGVIINTAAVIEHDVIIGDYVHIAPNATILGAANIGYNALVGAGSVVFPGISLGSSSILGAGSVLKQDIPKDTIYAGVVAKKIRAKRY